MWGEGHLERNPRKPSPDCGGGTANCSAAAVESAYRTSTSSASSASHTAAMGGRSAMLALQQSFRRLLPLECGGVGDGKGERGGVKRKGMERQVEKKSVLGKARQRFGE